MSFPQSSVSQNQNASSTPDAGGAASAALKLGQTGSLLGSFPGGNTGSAFGPGSQFANTFSLSPAANYFNTSLQGASLPGSLLNQALQYTGPQGALGNLFSLNQNSQDIYNKGNATYSSLLDSSAGGPFQQYLNQMVGPLATNNAIASGYGGQSGATLEALTRAGSNAAMNYGSMIPGLTQAGLSFAQTPQNLQLQGLQSLGLPMALQDYQNLQTGLQAGQLPNTMAQQYGLNMQAQLNALLAGLPFPVGTTQSGTGQTQNQGSVLGSILAPAAATALGLGGTTYLNSLLRPATNATPTAASALTSAAGAGAGGVGSALGNLSAGGTAAPEADFSNQLLETLSSLGAF